MKLSASARKIFSGRVIGLGMGRQAWAGSGLIAILCMQALAGPEGERVVAGQASFSRNGANTTIRAANNTIIDYRSFNIGANEAVRFIQPDASARVLNRVPNSVNPTRIDGSLRANGIVYIVNSAGVYFGGRAVVNAAGLYAAAGQITNSDFLNNINHFTGMQGTVSNSGTINAGAVALLGKQVENLGTINAERGLVTMASGDDVYIGELGGTMMVQVAGTGQNATPASGTGVNNAGTINAPGGTVRLAGGDMYSLAIKMPGRITGRDVKLDAQQGTAIVSGAIDARGTAPGEHGGSVQVLGDRVGLAGATIDASGPGGGGTVLVGGDFQGHGDTRTASQTVVTSGTSIRADATEQGDGGKVVVWSDQITRYSGNISAKGGAQGGDGGNVEVSGKQLLSFRGGVDTRAPKGHDGTILLDPRDIVIQAAAGADDGQVADSNIAFGDGGAGTTYTIGEAALEALTGSITLQATRDITVNAGVTLDLANQGAGETVTFQAGRNITVGGTITTSGAGITFTANDAGGTPADGSIIINAVLSTAGAGGVAGDITLNISGGTGAVRVGANLLTDGGNITITGPLVMTADNLSFDTEQGNDGNAGNINLTGATLSAAAGSNSLFSLTLNTSTTGGTAGTISLGLVDGSGGGFLNDLTLSAVGSVASGRIDLFNNISLDSNGGDLASFTATGSGVVINSSLTIDTEDANDGSAGTIDFSGAPLSAAAFGLDLTLNTATTATTSNGGAVTLGAINSTLGGSPLNDIAINTSGTSTAGTTTLGGNISLDANGGDLASLTVTGGGGVVLTTDVNIDTEQGNDGAGGDVNFGTSAISGNAAGRDLTIDTSTTAGASAGGVVSLASMSNGGGAFLNDVSINTSGTSTSGAINLGGNISLDANAGDLASLTFTGGGGVVLTTNVTIDTEQGNDGAGGAVNFGASALSGNAAGRDLTINTATTAGASNGGAVTLGAMSNAGGAFLNDVSSNTSGTAASGIVTLGGNISLDANGGDLASFSVAGGGSVVLSTSVTIDTEQGNDGAGGDVTFGTSALSGDSGGRDLTINTATTAGSSAGGAVSLVVLSNAGGAFLNDVSIDTSGTSSSGTITLGGNISLDNLAADAASFAVTGGGSVVLSTGITIDTEAGNDGAGGSVSFGTSALSGSSAGLDLTINTATTAAASNGGGVTLGAFSNAGGSFLNDVSITTTGTAASGVLTLGGNISLDNNAADLASFTVTGGGNVVLSASVTIDTENGNSAAGGNIDLGTSAVSGSSAGLDLTLNTATTAAASSGGAISLGVLDNSGGAFLNDVAIDTSGTTSAGTLTLNGNISLDTNAADVSSFSVTGAPVVIAASLTIDTESGNDAAAGAVTFGAGALSASSAGVDLTITTSTTAAAAAGGAITLPVLSNGGGAFLNDVALSTAGGAGGTNGAVTLGGNISLDNNAGDLAGFTVTGGGNVVLTTSVTIDTESGNSAAGGNIDFGTSAISGSAVGLDLTLNTATTAAASNGGAIALGAMNSAGGAFLNDLTIDTSGTGTAGTLTLTGNLSLDTNAADTSSILITGAPVVIGASLTIDTEQGNNAAAGTINFGSGGLSASSAGIDLTLNTATTSAAAAGGGVSLPALNNAGGAFLNDVSISRAGGAGGTNGLILLGGNISLDNNAGDAASFVVNDAGTITFIASRIIDTEQGNNGPGGAITLSAATISVAFGGLDLTLDSSTTDVASAGGNVAIPSVSNSGGAFLNDLTINAGGGSGGGVVSLGSNIALDANVADTGDLTITGASAITLSASTTIDTDATGGNTNAGSVSFPTTASIDGAFALTIDVSADGGGTSNTVTLLSNLGSSTPLTNVTLTGAAIDLGPTHVTGNIALTADDIDFTGGAASLLSNGGAGTLTIQPTANNVSIRVGASGAGTLVLDTTDVDAIGAFGGGAFIGRAAGTALTTVGSATFGTDTTIRQGGVGGSIAVAPGAAVATSGGASLTFSAGSGDAGNFTQGAGATINTGAGDLTFLGDSIDLLGGANTITVTGPGTITLTPTTAARPIVIGAAGAASDFALDTGEMAAFTDGSAGVTIGGAGSSGAVTMNALTFNDPLSVLVPLTGGTINVAGNLTLGSGASLTLQASPNTITLNADISALDADITLNDNVIVVGSRALTITGVTGGDISITGTLNGTTAGADTLTMTTSNGGITLGDVAGGSIPLGALTFTATTSVTLTGNVSVTGGGNVDFTTSPAILCAAATTIDTDATGGATNGGDILFGAASTLNVNPASAILLDATADGGGTNGDVTLGIVGNTGPNLPTSFIVLGQVVTLNGDITAAGVVSLGLGGGTTVLATSPTITIDNTAGANDAISVRHVSGNRGLTLTGDPGSALFVIGADVDTLTLTGATLTLGTTIETDTAQDYTGVGPIHLFNNTTLIAQDSDAANAPQNITTGLANVITGAATLTVVGNVVSLAAIGDSVTDPTALTINAAGGVTLGDTSIAGPAVIDADTDMNGTGAFTLSTTTTMTVGAGGASITAADLVLDGTLDATGNPVLIRRSANGTIGVGDAAGDMQISKAELSRISALGFTIGDSNKTASITVDNVAAGDVANLLGTFTLDATGNGGSITFSGAASTLRNLNARADDGIQVAADITTTLGAIVLNADFDNAADTSDALTFTAGRTVTSANSLFLNATTGNISAAGALTLSAANGITIGDALTTAGILTLDADTNTDTNGSITTAAGADLATGGADALLTASDVVLGAGVNAGAGTISLARSTPGTIRIAGAPAAGEMNLSGAELQGFAAAALNIGGTTASLIEVEGVSATESAGITGITQLSATADGGMVRFITAPATFAALSVNADDGVVANTNLTTSVGDLVINTNVDSTDDTNDKLSVGQNVSLISANDLAVSGDGITLTGSTGSTNTFTSGTDGNISLSAMTATNDINVTISSQNNVTLGTVQIAGGALGVTADSDGDGTATLATAGITAGAVTLAGGPDGNDTIDLNLNVAGTGGVTIQNAATINVGGNVNITSTTGDVALSSGVGSIVLTGADGTTNIFDSNTGTIRLAPVSSTNNPNLTLNSNGGAVFTAIDLNTGDLAVNSSVNAPSGSNIVIEAGDVSFNRAVTTSAGGSMTINNSGTLTLTGNPAFNLDGAFAQSGAGPVSLSGTITTTGDNIAFNSAIVLNGPATLDTGAGPGDITFLSSVRSDADVTARNLTLSAGTGNITAGSTIGDGGVIDLLLISGANNATFSSTVSTNAVSQVTGAGTTTFAGSLLAQGASGIDLNGNNFVFQGAVVTTGAGGGFSLTNAGNADFQSTSNIALAGPFLQDGTGAVTLAAPITTSLAPISFAAPVSIPAAITIANNGAGDITFGSTLTTTQPVTIDGSSNGTGNINFNGAVSATGELIARTGTGSITFANSITANSAITAAAQQGAVTFNGPLSVTGALSASTTTGPISFASSVITGSAFSVTSTSGNVQFGGAVNGVTAGTGILILNAGTGDITFNSGANVGATTSVQRFSATARNITVRGVRTEGTAAPNDGDITLTPDLTVTQNQVTENPGQVETDNRPNGIVTILGNLIANSGDITIGGAGRTIIPSVATTIVGDPGGTGNFSIAAANGSVNFGAFDKLTAFGNLTLAGVNVTFSDAAVAGALVVNANSISLRQRVGALLDRPGTGPNGLVRNQVDFGSNIVANNGITFASPSVTTIGTGNAPSFAASNGVGTGVPSNFPVAIRTPFSNADLFAGGVALGIDARGTTDTGLASALASALPRDTSIGAVAESTSVGQAEQDQLKQLRINPRDLREDELVDFLSGRSLYEDIVLDPGASADDYLVSVNRLPLDQVERVLKTYRDVFKKPRVNPDTGEQLVDESGKPVLEDRDRDIRDELAASLRRFRREGREGTLDPIEFRRYLEHTPEEAKALDYVEALQRFFVQLHLLGLGPKEETNSKRTLLGRVCPSGIRVQQLEQAVMAPEEAIQGQ